MMIDWAAIQSAYEPEGLLSTYSGFASLLAIILGCVLAQISMTVSRHKVAGKAMFAILAVVFVAGLMMFDGWRAATQNAMNSVHDFLFRSW